MNSTGKVEIYADGACSGNPGPGGWAARVFEDGVAVTTLHGGANPTTNNQMELTSVIAALSYLEPIYKSLYTVTLVLDSQYVLKGMETWSHSWAEKGWHNAQRKPVQNVELWKELCRLRDVFNLRMHYRWVKGHGTDVHNCAVDQIAVAAVKRSRETTESWIDEL